VYTDKPDDVTLISKGTVLTGYHPKPEIDLITTLFSTKYAIKWRLAITKAIHMRVNNTRLLLMFCIDIKNRRIEHIEIIKKSACANLGSGALKNQ
jgi:hypothetical protein